MPCTVMLAVTSLGTLNEGHHLLGHTDGIITWKYSVELLSEEDPFSISIKTAVLVYPCHFPPKFNNANSKFVYIFPSG